MWTMCTDNMLSVHWFNIQVLQTKHTWEYA